jgi:hypothetical protein
MSCRWLLLLLPLGLIRGQEAISGVDLKATIGTEAIAADALTEFPRNGSGISGGFRAVLYPTWKLDEHWILSGALQFNSRPYFPEEFSTQGNGLNGRILQLNLGYSKLWKHGSAAIRAGQLSSAFGAFLLRYDDAENALLTMPMQYGYYSRVTTAGLAGAQADATLGKWDGRIQFVNSSPANPRSIFASDQYGNWAGGGGYTVKQGLRIGLSAYRGPYLNRQSRFYFPGESRPRDLPATAGGVDVEWAQGHWNLYGEWQRFEMNYHAIPTFRQDAGYLEARRVLHPRWFVAARAGYLHGSFQTGGETYETSVGFRPNAFQLLKVGFSVEHPNSPGLLDRTFGIQLVTMLHPLSLAWN